MVDDSHLTKIRRHITSIEYITSKPVIDKTPFAIFYFVTDPEPLPIAHCVASQINQPTHQTKLHSIFISHKTRQFPHIIPFPEKRGNTPIFPRSANTQPHPVKIALGGG